MSAALPQVRSGKLKALAVTSTHRSPLLRELPTISESGLPGYAVDTWFGLLAPGRTSADIVNQLNRAIAESVAASDVRDTFARSALEPAANSPSQFAALLKAEVAKWRPVVRSAKLEID